MAEKWLPKGKGNLGFRGGKLWEDKHIGKLYRLILVSTFQLLHGYKHSQRDGIHNSPNFSEISAFRQIRKFFLHLFIFNWLQLKILQSGLFWHFLIPFSSLIWPYFDSLFICFLLWSSRAYPGPRLWIINSCIQVLMLGFHNHNWFGVLPRHWDN